MFSIGCGVIPGLTRTPVLAGWNWNYGRSVPAKRQARRQVQRCFRHSAFKWIEPSSANKRLWLRTGVATFLGRFADADVLYTDTETMALKPTSRRSSQVVIWGIVLIL